MSQYNPLLAERHFPLVGHTDRPYYDRVHPQHNHWPHYYNDSPPQLTAQPSAYLSDNNTWQNNTNSPHISAPPSSEHFSQAPHSNAFPSLTDYPESSQRTILTSSPDSNENGLHPIYSYKNDQRRSQSSHSSDYGHSTLWDANTPSVDEFQYPDLDMHPEDREDALVDAHCPESRQTSLPTSVSTPPSLHPSVKVEPEDPDGCFIMELSSMSPGLGLSAAGLMNHALAPPTEVPLRATQASKEMRKMMGVFRLNPFAMHSGEGRGVVPAPWCGGGPLEEEPLIFEFQLDIEDDSGDRTRESDHLADASGASGSHPTDSLGAEEEAQLRSFSPSFELHPEDHGSQMGEEHEQEQEGYADQDQQNEWSDADYCNHSEVDTSSTPHSVHTPSESQSAHTPFNESQSYQYPTPPPPAVSTWDIEPYQPHIEEHLPPVEKMDKMHRLHTKATSHPYIRLRSHLNHQASPSSSTHSLSQSHAQPHTPPQLPFGYSVLQQPTHHQHQHYNEAPSQNHSQSYSQLPTFHGSMISAAAAAAPQSNLELIPVSSHRHEDTSYMRSGRTLKLVEDETSTLHHHPAGIANEYTPRGSTSGAYTSQHDTHASGHQYETVSPLMQPSSSGHVFAPSRRWSLPETIGHSGGPFRSTM